MPFENGPATLTDKRPRTFAVRSPLVQLTLTRAREFYRRPSAIFWVYGFPLLLALALSLAFRSRPVQQVRVDVVAGPGGEAAAAALAGDPRLVVAGGDGADAARRLRTGKIDLVVVPLAQGYEFHFDPTRAESVL